jgi:hypothetical protein
MDSSSLSRRDACNLFPVNAVYVYVPAQMHANSKSAQPHISDFKYPGVSFLHSWQLPPCFLHHQKCTTCIREAKKVVVPFTVLYFKPWNYFVIIVQSVLQIFHCMGLSHASILNLTST